MLAMNVIDPTKTEWPSSIAFVNKKDETLRFCVTYRKYNAVTIQVWYANTLMDGCVDSLCNATKHWTPDASSGCWLVKITKKDRIKPF